MDAKAMVDEAFILSMRNAKRAELAVQGDRICTAFEQLRSCRSEEDTNIILSIVTDEVTKFRLIQARA